MAGTLSPDTTSKPITGKSGNADFTWDDGTTKLSLKCILDMFRVREVIEMTNADTFCTEGQADQEPGRSQLVGEITGLLKYDGPSSGPLIGIAGLQNAELVLTYFTACTITFKANFTEATAERVVNANARMSARFLSKGAYVVAWDKSGS